MIFCEVNRQAQKNLSRQFQNQSPQHIDDNARTAQSQEEYVARHEELVEQYETAKNELDSINEEKQARNNKRETMTRFIADIKDCEGLLADFDEPLWFATVDSVTVNEGSAAFMFKDGTVIETEIL